MLGGQVELLGQTVQTYLSALFGQVLTFCMLLEVGHVIEGSHFGI